jgi:hypothetical protein
VRFNFELLSGSTVVLEARRRMDLGGDGRTRTRPQSVAWLTLAVGLHGRLASDWQLVSSAERERAVADLAAIVSGRRGVRPALRLVGEQAPPAPDAPRAEQDTVETLAVLDAVDRALYAPGGPVAVVRAALQTDRRAGNAIRRAGRTALRELRRRATEDALDDRTPADAPLTGRDAGGAELHAGMLATLWADPRGRQLFEDEGTLRADVAAVADSGRITRADLAGWLRLSLPGVDKWLARLKKAHQLTDR